MLAAVLDLLDSAPVARRADAREPLAVLLAQLLRRLPPEARRRAAERLAVAGWTPPALLHALAADVDADLAAPVLALAPALPPPVLAGALRADDARLRAAVARRADLPPALAAQLARDPACEVMEALAANAQAHLPREVVERLVSAAREHPGLRSLLARRPELDVGLAARLRPWAGDAARAALDARFGPEDPEGVDRPDEEELERRLVAKLDRSGQLRPGYLLRVLRDGRLSLFGAALATLAGLDPGAVRDALSADGPERLALACAAVGVDRSAFPTLLSLVRSLNGDRPMDGPDPAAELVRAFCDTDRERAADDFRRLAAGRAA